MNHERDYSEKKQKQLSWKILAAAATTPFPQTNGAGVMISASVRIAAGSGSIFPCTNRRQTELRARPRYDKFFEENRLTVT